MLEEKWQTVGQIIYASGKKRYFRNYSIDINTMGASAIAKDKDYANFFMAAMGHPVVPGRAFYSPAWAKAIGSFDSTVAACQYAVELGFPVYVKPNSSSQGQGVAVCRTKRELRKSLSAIFRFDNVALVQRPVIGKDYRIVVLGNKVISAYERLPLCVVGDGKSSIKTLLDKKQRTFVRTGRGTIINLDDERMRAKLAHQRFTLDSIPRRQERIFLLDNANLSTGGEALDVTNRMHDTYKDLAVRLTADMGLTLCGVDLMVNGDIGVPTDDYTIL